MCKSGPNPIANIGPVETKGVLQTNKLSLVAALDEARLAELGADRQIEAALANYELAYRMQSSVPDVLDLRGETEATKSLYGFSAKYKHTRTYATQCLLARRLVERGVRFIELTCPRVAGDRWDQHSNLKTGHENNARAVDQPIAALLKDLKARGLLDETLVIWAGEFGRTPFAQGRNGRDHNPFGFTIWMAGGGIKGGTIHGATDEFGYFAQDDKVHVHDLHATLLHCLGMRHKDFSFRHQGREFRLTDEFGDVVAGLLE